MLTTLVLGSGWIWLSAVPGGPMSEALIQSKVEDLLAEAP